MTPTHAAWAALPLYVLLADGWLIRHGHDTMSSLARRHPTIALTGVTLLACHLARAWRYDPLHMLGQAARAHRRPSLV